MIKYEIYISLRKKQDEAPSGLNPTSVTNFTSAYFFFFLKNSEKIDPAVVEYRLIFLSFLNTQGIVE